MDIQVGFCVKNHEESSVVQATFSYPYLYVKQPGLSMIKIISCHCAGRSNPVEEKITTHKKLC
jgi:hypothetical protein